LIIEFTEYPGRAYTWLFDSAQVNNQYLKYTGVKRISLGDGDDSQEKVEYSFLTVGKGSTKLNFKYQRPWEKTKPAADSCKINIYIE
jgi:predicted secreted protein